MSDLISADTFGHILRSICGHIFPAEGQSHKTEDRFCDHNYLDHFINHFDTVPHVSEASRDSSESFISFFQFSDNYQDIWRMRLQLSSLSFHFDIK